MTRDADILDDLFSACALAAFLDQSARQQSWPDPEATRRRAYQLYEEELAAKNGSFDNRRASRYDRPMSNDIDISHLSPAECILLAERLWDRASRRPDDVPIPPEHGKELDRRLAAIEAGTMGPGEPWDAVRNRLWKR